MRILVALVHYFAGEQNPRHSSTNAARRDERAGVVRATIDSYRGMFGPPAILDIAGPRFIAGVGTGDEIDIALITVPGCSLVDDDFCRARGVTKLEYRPQNPRMLGFYAHELFAELHSRYDMFAFTEDDLRVSDPMLFAKIAWFNHVHGDRRLLQPNRFEWNGAGPGIKTYVDGDLPRAVIDPLLARVPDQDGLALDALGRSWTLRRALNPHSGFFAITQTQLGLWMRDPHWLDRDCSFYSPLESSATLAVAKSFSIYKPFAASAGFLELQHLDSRFTTMNLPRVPTDLAAIATRQSAVASGEG